jgi:hypothetical protein
VVVAAAAVSVLLRLSSAFGQQSLDQRYQQALASFNNANMEDACELFGQIEKESPNYKDTRTYLNPSCSEKKRLYDMEERLFKEGTELYKEGNLDDAKQKFDQASRISIKTPKYRSQIATYLKDIDGREADESAFQEAVALFNKGKDDEAAAGFSRLAQARSAHADESRTYLQRIEERRQARPFDAAVMAFNGSRYDEARRGFQQVVQAGGAHAAEARDYLQRIDAALKREASIREAVAKAQAGTKDPLQVAKQFLSEAQAAAARKDYASGVEKLRVALALDPANQEIRKALAQFQDQAADQNLRSGLRAYFEARYDEAERAFTDYLINTHGRRQALAYFYRAAVHGSLYFLSDQQDTAEKQKALADFVASQQTAQSFRPKPDIVSPKILALYAETSKVSTAQGSRRNP